MNSKVVHRIFATAVFLISAVQFFITAQPSVSFWDPGELSAAAFALEVPHPPGGPLFSLIGHFFYMLPLPGNVGFRMNAVSVLASAFSVLFLYLIAVRLIRSYKGRDPQSALDAYGTYVSAAIGALALSFCGTFWFNGGESNYFATATVLFSAMTWLMMVWYEKSDEPGSWKYFLIIAYLVGLSAGVHLMSVLTFFAVVMLIVMKRYVHDDGHYKKTAYIFAGHAALILVIALIMWGNQTGTEPPSGDDVKEYDTTFKVTMALISIVYLGIFWKKVFNKNSFYLPIASAGVALSVVYPGIIKKLPTLLVSIAGDNSAVGVFVLIAVFALLGYGAYWSWKNKKGVLAVAAVGAILALAGVTTYTMTIIRANQHPPMNENDPNSFSRLVTYLNREQYGDFPMFKRRWSGEPQHQTTWTNYSSDLDFFTRYQMNHMFTRYLLWNFAGRESFVQDTGVNWKQLFGIPFFVGLFGLYYHFRRDWKIASVFLVLFILMGYLTAFYQNQQEWQPRERDYFYAGAYFVFALWIALGIRGLLDLIEPRIKGTGPATAAFSCVLLVAVVFIPGRMWQTNYFTHDRSKNWIPWDYSYNLLQSCAPNSILFTNGDNDTFPLWYLQDVEGIRRDVRIVNLSLVNTEWYIKQLKHEEPYGTARVKISFSDDYIDRLQPVQWKPQTMTLPVPRQMIAGEMGMTSGILDSSVYKSGAITFTMPATLHYGDINAIRVQDIMVKEIIQQNAWIRPIYFASTCGEDTKIGLSDYIKIEGFAGRLVPQKRAMNQVMPYYIDPEKMSRNLLQDAAGISKTFQPGFLFRELNDRKVFYDENEQRMVQNCTGSFMMLAIHYLYVANDKAMSRKVLDRLEQVIPREVIKPDMGHEYQLALVYYNAGDTAKYREISSEVEQIALAKIKENPLDFSEANNPYQVLTEIYDRTSQYSKAAELLEGVLPNFPNDQGLKQQIERYKAQAEQQKNQNKPK
jgi:hypothetical protein